VSGDLDGLIVVWEIKRKRRDLLVPLRFLSGGGKSKLKSLAFSSLLDIVVSGYIDGTIAIHTLHGGYFIRSLDLGGVFKDGVDILKISVDDAKVLAYSYSSTCIVIFDINGNALCKKVFSYPVN
jgi:WD40 repeat protein